MTRDGLPKDVAKLNEDVYHLPSAWHHPRREHCQLTAPLPASSSRLNLSLPSRRILGLLWDLPFQVLANSVRRNLPRFRGYLVMANTKKGTPSEASTRVSRRTSTSTSRMSLTSLPVRTKTRGLSTASLDSSESGTSEATLKPNGATRSPNATPVPSISPAAKRMSTSIPTPISRRQSMILHSSNGPFKPELSSSNSFSQVMRKIGTPPSVSRQRHVTTTTLPPSSLLDETFPLQEPITIAPSTPRHRVLSYNPPRKANTLDATPSPKPNASPKPSPSPQKTPAKKVGTPKSVTSTPTWSPPNSLDRKNGIAVARFLASESPSRAPAQSVRGSEVFPVFDTVLDGDDMTLELITELNDGEVDEDVSLL